jgi:hypothetical protein
MRLVPNSGQPKGTIVALGGFDSFIIGLLLGVMLDWINQQNPPKNTRIT